MFSFQLDCLSENHSIDFNRIMGQRVSIGVELPDKSKRYFNGFINRFSQLPNYMGLARYQAEMVPWLWFLTRSSDCRIFRDKSVPEIVADVFERHKFKDHDIHTLTGFPKLEYCVQYRETAANFVMRLMEREGIFFYFKHEKDRHTLATAKSLNECAFLQPQCIMHQTFSGAAQIRTEDMVSSWCREQEIRPNWYTLGDYDFEQPSRDLRYECPGIHGPPEGHELFKMYDYPIDSGSSETNVNKRHVENRIKEQEAHCEVVSGASTCRHFSSGYSFDLKGHTRSDQNCSYVITSVMHNADANYDEANAASDKYGNTFTCIPADAPYRPPRVTPKPYISGTQTAVVVVANEGEDFLVDNYGRVKVQFHWDRVNKKNDKSSCWIRIATSWAGQQWGAIHLPRVGQEVVVDFLEGDPDRPIIIGSVFNADNMPLYALPEHQTQSGIKSRSSKDGSPDNFNEFRFEDKKGEEEIYCQAERNLSTVVKADETREIGKDQTEKIGGDRSLMVTGTDDQTLTGKQTIIISADQTCTITGNQTETVGQSITLTAGMSYTLTAGMAITVTSGAAVTITAPMITLNAPMVMVNGVLMCQTMIASAGVVSPMYSPGLGNLL